MNCPLVPAVTTVAASSAEAAAAAAVGVGVVEIQAKVIFNQIGCKNLNHFKQGQISKVI